MKADKIREAIKVLTELQKWYPEKTIDIQEVYNAIEVVKSHLSIAKALKDKEGI